MTKNTNLPVQVCEFLKIKTMFLKSTRSSKNIWKTWVKICHIDKKKHNTSLDVFYGDKHVWCAVDFVWSSICSLPLFFLLHKKKITWRSLFYQEPVYVYIWNCHSFYKQYNVLFSLLCLFFFILFCLFDVYLYSGL